MKLPFNIRLPELLRLARPKQWVKNGFVLAPLVFAKAFHDLGAVSQAFAAFGLFCVASSATYILNDLRDIERDRSHPVKSWSRPLAAGTVKPATAIALLVALYAVLVAGVFWSPRTMAVIAGYLALNFAYSFWLKHQPVLDIWGKVATDVRGEVIPQCGHYLPEEQPAIVGDRLLRFADECFAE